MLNIKHIMAMFVLVLLLILTGCRVAGNESGNLDSEKPDTWFTNVASMAKVLGGPAQDFKYGFGSGTSWADYDNDGDLDIYIAGVGNNLLYRNEGDGTFKDVTKKAQVRGRCNSYGVAWGDYDNDKDLDLYVVCHSEDQWSNLEHKAHEPNLLYRNNGDGTFSEIAKQVGVDYVSHGTGAAWIDYNLDGHLDLYVTNYGIYGDGREGWGDGNVLYKNNGDGTFRDISAQAGLIGREGLSTYRWAGGKLTRTGMTFSSLWFDYDNDGDQDVVECNDQGVSPLYRNDLNDSFVDVTEEAGLFVLGDCMGIDAGDYDKDGWLDIYWTNYDENYLWKNNGDGTFTEVGQIAGVSDINIGWATGFLDFDNDGYLDIYVTNGIIGLSVEDGNTEGKPVAEANILYRNKGDGTFEDVTQIAGIGDSGVGRGTGIGDYNNDGAIDLYVVNSDKHNLLYRNNIGASNNWIKIKLVGSDSNSYGIGARVTVTTETSTQLYEITNASGYLGGNGIELICGVGQDVEVDEIRIDWPSGLQQILENVAVNQVVIVREGIEYSRAD